MAGSPYLDAGVALAQLPQRLALVTNHPRCVIATGYFEREDAVDVMRGEETQLLGAASMGVPDAWVVLPGTHSKNG